MATDVQTVNGHGDVEKTGFLWKQGIFCSQNDLSLTLLLHINWTVTYNLAYSCRWILQELEEAIFYAPRSISGILQQRD